MDRNLKLVVNISPDTRAKLEIVRAFLMVHHPLSEMVGLSDCFEFLLDTAPIQEMIDFIGAHHREKVRERHEFERSDQFIETTPLTAGAEPGRVKTRKRGRKAKQGARAASAQEQGRPTN